ncbi:MAG: carboxypeptidase-like regulatory domain-containing protein, partial [Acidobacteria bacterium]|nr:carboxypeptidase-like regulatory domain-containing protein [Acidobacteriota bacterium]
GRFTMAVPPGNVRFVAHDDTALYAGSFYNDAESFSVADEFLLSSGQFLSGIDFRVQKAGRVAGRVTDAATGAALQGIYVVVYNLSGTVRQIVTSDATGAFKAVVPPGYYKIAAFDEAKVYADQFWASRTTFALADTLLVSAGQESSVSWSLHRNARISGSTTDRDLGTPLSGIVVAAMDATGAVIASVVSDGSGTFMLVLPPGSYKLAASDPAGLYKVSYEGSASSFETAPSRNLTAGQVVTEVAFELSLKAVPSQVRRRLVTRPG